MDHYKKILKLVNTLYVVLTAPIDKLSDYKKVELLENISSEFDELILGIKDQIKISPSNPIISQSALPEIADEQLELDIPKINKILKTTTFTKFDFINADLVPSRLKFIINDLNNIFNLLSAIDIFIDNNFKQTYAYNLILVHQFKRNHIEFYITDQFDEVFKYSDDFNDILQSNFDISIEVLIDVLMQTNILEEGISFNNVTLTHYE